MSAHLESLFGAVSRAPDLWDLQLEALAVITGLTEIVPAAAAVFLLLLGRGEGSWKQARRAVTTRTERGRSILIVILASSLLILVATFRPGADVSPFLVGRVLFSLLALTVIAYLLVLKRGGRDYQSVLKEVAEREGLTLIASPEEESEVQVMVTMRRFTDRDVRHWELDGSYPYLLSERPEGLLTVRIPRGFDFDRESPLSTRISCFRRTDLYGFTVRDRQDQRGHQRKTVLTGDADFDRLFRVSARRPQEVEQVLRPQVRRMMVEEGSVGYGFWADTYGTKAYIPDRALDADLVCRWIRIVMAAAGNLD